jgi:hypothetical protein
LVPLLLSSEDRELDFDHRRPLNNTYEGGNCRVWNTEIPHRPSGWIFVTHLVLHPILSLKDLSVGVIERKKSLQQLHNMILLLDTDTPPLTYAPIIMKVITRGICGFGGRLEFLAGDLTSEPDIMI